MTISIFLRFSTSPGQDIFISGSLVSEIGGNKDEPLLMNYLNEHLWYIVFKIDKRLKHKLKHLNYSYILKQKDDIDQYDSGKHRYIDLSSIDHDIAIVDNWNDMGGASNIFNSSPFHRVFFKDKNSQIDPPIKKQFHFTVEAPTLREDQRLIMTGNTMLLGNWLTSGYVEMQCDGKKWYAELDLVTEVSQIEYKYCVISDNDDVITYESGENRKLFSLEERSIKTLINDGYYRTNNYSWLGAGVAVPLFSLRTKQSLGVGDFNDLKKMVDWCSKISIKMVQLLPVNDTTNTHTWRDSYPYSSISSLALHPIYISIEKISGKNNLELVASLIEQGKKLNESKHVDYEAVMDIKWNALRLLYNTMYASTSRSMDFQKFLKKNAEWLIPYAVFSYFRDQYKTANYNEWNDHRQFTPQMLVEIEGQPILQHKECCFYFFIQYHLHKQLKDAHDYANKKGVILKGDIPIGVNRYGVETWTETEFFNLDMQAGAPPDDFAKKGQNWGFPTYNWSVMKQDGYQWWRKRFQHLSVYFDAIRIDHILGFFRIWSIPSYHVEGIMGKFVPAIPIMEKELKDLEFDCDLPRLCDPYITESVIADIAGIHTNEIKNYLEVDSGGIYTLRPGFNTQREVDLYFGKLKDNSKNTELKSILFSLISNVILLRDEHDVDAYHFRFNMANTSSFKDLNKSIKQKLNHLYNDYFYYRQDHKWSREAMDKLPILIKSTDMLICGEDLGFIPRCVPDVMRSLGLLSLEVQRMPKIPNRQFTDLSNLRYLSVVTPSTHDMSTLRAWWEENRKLSQQFYTEELSQHGTAPETADTNIIQSILLQHLSSRAQWSVFQIQDLLAIDKKNWIKDPIDERVNIPENPNHYWKYRMKVGIEELLKNNTLNNKLKFMIQSSGRA